MSLPERPTTVGQPSPLAGWPTEAVQPAAVELYQERVPVAYVPDPYNPGQSVAIDARLLQPMQPHQPRDLTPVPLIPPLAWVLLFGGTGGGALSAGVGWGVGQAAQGIATSGFIGGVAVVALLLLVAKLGRVGGGTHIEQHVHNHNRWFGRSTTSL